MKESYLIEFVGAIIVVPFLPIWAIVLLSVGGLVLLTAVTLSAAVLIAKWYPRTRVARLLESIHEGVVL